MTLQDIQEQIAESKGFSSYHDLLKDVYYQSNVFSELQKLSSEIADKYARLKWDEACKEQRQMIADHTSYWMNKEAFVKADQPEFR